MGMSAVSVSVLPQEKHLASVDSFWLGLLTPLLTLGMC